MMMSPPVLEAHKVSIRRSARVVVDCVSLQVRAGEMVALIGPNGAGKSTLLSALSGDRIPSAGGIRLGDRSLLDLSAVERAQARAVLPQQASLSFDLGVAEVVEMGRTPFRESRAVSRAIAREALDAVELGHAADRGYLQLSGGERQRVQLARFLAHTWPDAQGATVGLLDEPVASLDPRQQHRAMAVLRSLASAGRALVVVLHDLTLASMYADRVVVLRDGAILSDGSAKGPVFCSVLEAAFDTRFFVRSEDGDQQLVLPCRRADTLPCAACVGGTTAMITPLTRAAGRRETTGDS